MSLPKAPPTPKQTPIAKNPTVAEELEDDPVTVPNNDIGTNSLVATGVQGIKKKARTKKTLLGNAV